MHRLLWKMQARMKGQATLAAFSAPQTALPVFDCGNCQNQKGLFSIAGKPHVKCMGQRKDVPTNGCACYSDGKELETMASFAPPAGYLPKKWAGEWP
jgi:hypothetical protein